MEATFKLSRSNNTATAVQQRHPSVYSCPLLSESSDGELGPNLLVHFPSIEGFRAHPAQIEIGDPGTSAAETVVCGQDAKPNPLSYSLVTSQLARAGQA